MNPAFVLCMAISILLATVVARYQRISPVPGLVLFVLLVGGYALWSLVR